MPSEPGPSQKDAPGRVHSSGVPGAVRPTETESRGVGRAGGRRGLAGTGFLFGEMSVLETDDAVTVTQQHEAAGHGSDLLKAVIMVDFAIYNYCSENL